MAERNVPEVVAARYPRLYTATRDILRLALQLLRNRLAEPPQWPKVQATRIVFEENRSHTENLLEEAPGSSINQIYSELEASEPFRHATVEIEGLARDGRAIPIYWGASTYISPILTSYLDTQRSLEFNEDRFRHTYYQIEDYIGRDVTSTRLYLELPTLTGTLDRVILSDTHRIQRLDAPEINRLWRIMAPPSYPAYLIMRPPRWPALVSYCLQATVTYTKQNANQLGVLMNEEVIKVTRALRLSAVGTGSVQLLTYEPIGLQPEVGRFGFGQTLIQGSYGYQLNDDLSEDIKSYWPAAYELSTSLQKAPDKIPTHLRISSLRFSGSFDKTTPEDQLIDYAIGFEALFTKENDAISYRLPLRAAVFGGDTPEERQRIFAIVKAAYDLRSSLAHGQNQLLEFIKIRGNKVPVPEFLKSLSTILFLCVHRFARCSKSNSKDVLLRAIDDAVITIDRNALPELWR